MLGCCLNALKMTGPEVQAAGADALHTVLVTICHQCQTVLLVAYMPCPARHFLQLAQRDSNIYCCSLYCCIIGGSLVG